MNSGVIPMEALLTVWAVMAGRGMAKRRPERSPNVSGELIGKGIRWRSLMSLAGMMLQRHIVRSRKNPKKKPKILAAKALTAANKAKNGVRYRID